MVGVEEIECEGRFRATKGCRVPAHAKKLAVVLVGSSTRTTFTKANLQFVPAVEVNDIEKLGRGTSRTCVAIMPKMADVSERMQRRPVEKSVLPTLEMMSIWLVGQKTQTYLKAMQRQCGV